MATRTVLNAGPGALSDYYDWFKDAANGDILVYHTGDLQFDRDPSNLNPVAAMMMRSQIDALNGVANRVRVDAKDGFLVLMQKRLAESHFEYRAVRQRSDQDRQPFDRKVKDESLVLV